VSEYILCAAIWVDDGKVYAHQAVPTGLVLSGHRHHNIFAQMRPMWGFLVAERRANGVKKETQGFLTSTGRFVNRLEARQIAKAAGQVTGERGHLPGGKLDSGDLY
jgi:hypothetical protein